MQLDAAGAFLLAARACGKNMKIGVTGHQRRCGIDWAWVRDAIATELSKMPPQVEGLSCLAEGADQVFAEVILARGGHLRAIVPTPDYVRHFQGEARERYLALRSCAHVELLEPADSDEQSFFAAGRRIVDEADILFAVWDGRSSQGLGGTGDVVEYARARGKPVLHIDPISRCVFRPA